MAKLFSGYTEQERALSDGRIGPEIVKIDTSGRCGNMDISENLEVMLANKCPSFTHFTNIVPMVPFYAHASLEGKPGHLLVT